MEDRNISISRWVLILGGVVAAAAVAGIALAVVFAFNGSEDSPPPVVTTTTSIASFGATGASGPSGVEPAGPPPPPPGPPLCKELNRQNKEGLCQDPKGRRYQIVDQGSTLHLKELDVKLLGISTTEVVSDVGVERANGIYAIFTLEVTNRLNQPVPFSDNQTQTALLISKGQSVNRYSEDFDAENGGDKASFTWRFEDIQPDTVQTGTVIFDIPKSAVSDMYKAGALAVLNFSDAAFLAGRTKLPIGAFRLSDP